MKIDDYKRIAISIWADQRWASVDKFNSAGDRKTLDESYYVV